MTDSDDIGLLVNDTRADDSVLVEIVFHFNVSVSKPFKDKRYPTTVRN